MLSLTAISGRPTRTVLGSPAEASTSTSTGRASMPTSAKVLSLASIRDRPGRRRSVGNQGPFYPTPRRFAIGYFSAVRRCPAASAATMALSVCRPGERTMPELTNSVPLGLEAGQSPAVGPAAGDESMANDVVDYVTPPPKKVIAVA